MEKDKNKSTKEEITLQEMQQQLEALKMALGIMNTNQKQVVSSEEKDILFTSLNNGITNLSTLGNGNGEIYKFTQFGEEQLIPEADAKLLVKNNSNFIKSGVVYIYDEEFIKKVRIKSDYEKILNKEQLLDLFNKDRKEFESIFTKMTDFQKGVFTSLLANKIRNNENIDMNIIAIVNQNLNIDMMKTVFVVEKAKNNEEE